ncbi:junctional adhesion molecule 2A-like [Pararge aegeria]|uniref:junctional adhesion molecule 2A-like n=1 Tax=Pararge aegeria TaxID=116150 RepID=UPI0019CFA159|nr:junctional adhesion molecule 2A-like [Pararge aegeria]
MFVLYVIFSLLLIKESLLLRIVQVTVPSYRIRGQPAQLECDYELGGDTLYSVKWYRDNEEFYRYMPKYDPPKHSYKLEGVKVELSKSDDRRVMLHPVTLKSSGQYRCEVSAEAPSFASAAGEGKMEVIYLPREGPRITGNEQENRRGDSLFLNCTSGRSYPAAILSWDIDGEKVIDSELLVEYPPMQHSHGLLSSALGLRVPSGRTMQVRCTARVAPAWREGSEAIVGNSQLADSKEAMLLVRSSSAVPKIGIMLLTLSLLQHFHSLTPTIT